MSFSNLSVVIVNYVTPKLTCEGLASLYPNDSDVIQKTFIVDNKSPDDSLDVIADYIDKNSLSEVVSVIPSERNGGFSAGNNLGINACDSEFILLLNSDTIVRPLAIGLLVKTLIDNPMAGMASPSLEWEDGSPQESCFRFHRPISELIRSACTGPITKLLKRYDVPIAVSDKISRPEWTSFACVLVRREVFDQIGLLDEEYFMYFEDVDFCQRARVHGWDIIHNPDARMVHLGSGSSGIKDKAAQRKRMPRYLYESRTRYYYKYFGRGGLLAANLFWYLGWCVAMTRTLLSVSYQSNICEAQWKDIWTNFGNPNTPYVHPKNY